MIVQCSIHLFFSYLREPLHMHSTINTLPLSYPTRPYDTPLSHASPPSPRLQERRMALFLSYRALSAELQPPLLARLRCENKDILKLVVSFLQTYRNYSSHPPTPRSIVAYSLVLEEELPSSIIIDDHGLPLFSIVVVLMALTRLAPISTYTR